jgi:membrane protein YdbS with pleckstrin-like domain
MSTISHEPSARTHPVRGLASDVVEMWASLAIAVIWLAVLVTAVAGPDIVTVDAGGNSSTVPAAVAVALFAAVATWPIAKYGFAQRRKTSD